VRGDTLRDVTSMRRWLERALTVVLLAACGETLPERAPNDPPARDAAADDGPASDLDAGGQDVVVPIPVTCTGDSSVAATTTCAERPSVVAPSLVACETFDTADVPNAPVQSNGDAATSDVQFVSPPKSAQIDTGSSDSEVRINAGDLGPAIYTKAVLEADVRLRNVGSRFVLASFVSSSEAFPKQQTFELWVEADGKLSVATDLGDGGFADAGASGAGAGLCPGRWSHVKMLVQFGADAARVEVTLDGAGPTVAFPTVVSPGTDSSKATATIGVRATGAPTDITLALDNVQLYVF
jgi:hypothetical protein